MSESQPDRSKGDGIAGIFLGIFFGVLLASLAIFALGIGQAPPVDVDALYCDASADGWRAAHVRLYEYVESTNAEYFARAFVPLTPGGWDKLVASCNEDPEGIKKILKDLVAQADGPPLNGGGLPPAEK